VPDVIGSLAYEKPGTGHVRVAAMARRLRLVGAEERDLSATGWGLQVSGAVNTVAADQFILSFATGDGAGRYLLGVDPVSGGFVDPEGQLKTRPVYGGYAAYRRFWNRELRSNLMVGVANADSADVQSAGVFRRSYFAGGNFFVPIQEYISLGVEYVYGRRLNKDAPSKDNHRVQVGVQVF
jgi:hypothetical protein